MDHSEYTDFGMEDVPPEEKRRRVHGLFDSVAPNYDVMNDVMSLGVHRLWKWYAAHISGIKHGDSVLDVAGGTGDMAKYFSHRVGQDGSVFICDISYEMVYRGRNRLVDSGTNGNIGYIQGDAENLPFKDNQFDQICVAFGLRNMTDKAAAFDSMYSKLKFGGRILILEFSSAVLAMLKPVYRTYSKFYIPAVGRFVARDEPSYQYLVDSITRYPDQETIKGMMGRAGFKRVDYHNLSGGIVAVHRAFKL